MPYHEPHARNTTLATPLPQAPPTAGQEGPLATRHPDTPSIAEEYAQKYPQSRQLYEAAQAALPGGITHMARAFTPFPLYIDRCVGAHKWDVDGHEYIDYWMGHGAMLLGHAHPAVVEAVREQV